MANLKSPLKGKAMRDYYKVVVQWLKNPYHGLLIVVGVACLTVLCNEFRLACNRADEEWHRQAAIEREQELILRAQRDEEARVIFLARKEREQKAIFAREEEEQKIHLSAVDALRRAGEEVDQARANLVWRDQAPKSLEDVAARGERIWPDILRLRDTARRLESRIETIEESKKARVVFCVEGTPEASEYYNCRFNDRSRWYAFRLRAKETLGTSIYVHCERHVPWCHEPSTTH